MNPRCVLVLCTLCAVPIAAQSFEPQEGTASWYGDAFHGRKTASGELFNMNDMSAAHKTLPFNTFVRVTNLSTGTSVVVRINDRGPFVKGRIIDVSKAAAAILGMFGSGTARVRIEPAAAAESAPQTPPREKLGCTQAEADIRIQTASYTSAANAHNAVLQLAKAGIQAYIEISGRYHRILVFSTQRDFKAISAALDAAGCKERLVRKLR